MPIQDDIDDIDLSKPINPPVTTSAPKPTTASVRANFSAIKLALQGLLDVLAGFALSLSGKQDALVSGSNIKTINGDSILGSGDLTVSGGGGGGSASNDIYNFLNF